MSNNSAATYHLYSTLPGEPNVGIYYLHHQQQEQQQQQQRANGQPVRLAADLVEWVASPAIVGRGPTRLSAGPYQYTYERNKEVIATNQHNLGQDWYIIPFEAHKEVCYISADSVGNNVWTAGERGEPIKIKRFTGEVNQVFKFVQRVD